MAAQSTETWSNDSGTRTTKEWKKSKSWTVVDAATEDEAYNATPMPGSLAIPKEGQYLGDGSSYGVVSRSAKKTDGPTTWTVTCELSTNFNKVNAGGGSPLLAPPTMTVKPGNMSIACEYDVHNHAITNSAKDPFNTITPKEIPFVDLIVERNEPIYDLSYYQTFANGVNGSTVNIAGLSVPPRCMFCRMPEMVSEWQFGTDVVNEYVRVRYVFSICIDKRLPNPWDYAPTDIGDNGWYSDGGTQKRGRFMGPSGYLTNVRLKGNGTPMDPSITVEGKPPVPPDGWTAPQGTGVEKKGDIYVITYEIRNAVTPPTF